jgi:hypothetical protein
MLPERARSRGGSRRAPRMGRTPSPGSGPGDAGAVTHPQLEPGDAPAFTNRRHSAASGRGSSDCSSRPEGAVRRAPGHRRLQGWRDGCRLTFLHRQPRGFVASVLQGSRGEDVLGRARCPNTPQAVALRAWLLSMESSSVLSVGEHCSFTWRSRRLQGSGVALPTRPQQKRDQKWRTLLDGHWRSSSGRDRVTFGARGRQSRYREGSRPRPRRRMACRPLRSRPVLVLPRRPAARARARGRSITACEGSRVGGQMGKA